MQGEVHAGTEAAGVTLEQNREFIDRERYDAQPDEWIKAVAGLTWAQPSRSFLPINDHTIQSGCTQRHPLPVRRDS